MMTCPVFTFTPSPRRQIPPPGALSPAMVRFGWRMTKRFFSVIVPPVRKMIVRGPSAATAARRLPGIGASFAGS